MVQTAIFDLGHVYQTIAFAKEVHESPKIHDFDNRTFVDCVHLGFGHDRMDHVIGLLDGFAIWRCDLDGPFVVDVDLGARHFDDLADHLAARTDHFADFVRWDLHCFNARCMGREFASAGQRLVHLAQDVQPAFFRLSQSFFHDFGRDARNLDIHLKRRDAVFGACNLEIHVAEVILVAKNVSQDRVFAVILKHQTHGHTSHCRFQRNTRIHHRQRPATDGRHGRRPVGFRDLGHQTHCIGEIGRGGQNGLKGAPCQFAMADFTTARRANAASFAHRIGGEVVVQQEVRFVGTGQRVDHLFVVAGAQCGHNQTLGFATCEQRRPMGTGQQAGFGHDVAHFVGLATIDPLAVLDHVTAQNAGFQLFQCGPKVCIGQLILGQGRFDGVLGRGNGTGAFLFVSDRIGGAHLVFARSFDSLIQRAVIWWLEIERLFRGVFGQRNDQVHNRLKLFVGKIDGAQHFFFGQLVCFGFHHHHGVFGPGDNQIQTLFWVFTQLVHVLDIGVQHVFAIDIADATPGNRAAERRAGNRQRS